MSRVCNILGIQKPVIQAPMMLLTLPKFVAAVSNAGGLGVLGITGPLNKPEETVSQFRSSIRKIKELTNKPFGVNVFTTPSDPFGLTKLVVNLCKEENVKILVAVGPSSPKDFKQWKDDGFTVISRELNPTVRGAVTAEKAGADIIVATGCDEGGCMPSISTGTTSAVALLSDAVKVPVLAAGGIINEKTAKAAAIVGAEGAYVGTRFILSKECPACDAAKKDILNTHPDDFITFKLMNGMAKFRTTPHKAGKKALQENLKGNLNPSPGNVYASMFEGKLEEGCNSVCNIAPLIKSIDSCKDIVDEIARAWVNK